MADPPPTRIDASRALGRDRDFYLPSEPVRDFARRANQYGSLSTAQPIRITSPKGLTGLLSSVDVRTGRSLLNNAREIARVNVDEAAVVDTATVQFSRRASAEADGLRAAITNTRRANVAIEAATNALTEIEAKLQSLLSIAENAAEATDVDRIQLDTDFTATLDSIDPIANAVVIDGVGLVNAPGGPTLTAGSVTASVAQTATLNQNETITFDDFGAFEGLSSGQRSITINAGKTQAQVVSAINSDASIGTRVSASVDGSGKLVLTALNSGTDGSFRVTSNRAAASDQTGIGTTILNGKGTDSTDTSAAVTASVAQTGGLGQTERLTFEDFGLFAGLSAADRRVDFLTTDTQSTVVTKINLSNAGKYIEASVDNNGKLVLTAKEAGAGVSFRASSNRTASATSTGIGTAIVQGDGSSTTATAPFVRATSAQTLVLSQSETLTFGDSGIFAGLTLSQRQISFAAGTTQAQVVSAINADADLAPKVTASVDNYGRLKITADTTGAGVFFDVVSNRGTGANRTGIGNTTKLGNNGFDTAPITEGKTVLGGLKVDVGNAPQDTESIEFESLTTSSLLIGGTNVSTVDEANEAITKLTAALDKVHKEQSKIAVQFDKFSQNEAVLRARRGQSVKDSTTAYQIAVDVRLQAKQQAADLVNAQTSLRTPGQYQQLVKTLDEIQGDRNPRGILIEQSRPRASDRG
jgi:hypothetical protein